MFKDRFDAAQKLVPLLSKYKDDSEAIVLAIPRGGLELGYVLAKKLELPLDVIFTKKIGLPANPEYAIGAVSEKQVYIDENFKNNPELQKYIDQEVQNIRKVIKARNELYRKNMPPFDITNKTVIIVDDGVATGKTLLVTLHLVKEYNPKKIVVALPVAPQEALQNIKEYADEVVCALVPEVFYSVGQFYIDFHQVEDDEAQKLLQEANQ